MKKDNVEALKSSVLTGVAFGTVVGGSLFLANNPHFLCVGVLAIFAGFCVGLLTTWYPDGE